MVCVLRQYRLPAYYCLYSFSQICITKMDVEETFRRSLYTSYGENKCILLPKEEYIKTVGESLEATLAHKKSPR